MEHHRSRPFKRKLGHPRVGIYTKEMKTMPRRGVIYTVAPSMSTSTPSGAEPMTGSFM